MAIDGYSDDDGVTVLHIMAVATVEASDKSSASWR
jgi:hypothetical protein